jgi:uncharacterized protein YndB with AHSA1/START domain
VESGQSQDAEGYYNQMSKDKKDKLSTVLLAIGDPTRREILKKVSKGEPSVLEIAESFRISLPAISKHLKVLERAGLISRKREGRVHRFKLIARPMKDASEWIRNYEQFWHVQLNSLGPILRSQERRGKAMGKRHGDKRHTIKIVRTFDADPEVVYRAWTDPKVMEKWFAPQEMTTPIAEVDLKVGGKYRIGMKSPDGELYVAIGTYREIIPNKKLVFTWRWESEPSDISDTLVAVEFKKSGEHTKLVFTHENFTTEELTKDHQEGWEGALSKLSRIVMKGRIGHGK